MQSCKKKKEKENRVKGLRCYVGKGTEREIKNA